MSELRTTTTRRQPSRRAVALRSSRTVGVSTATAVYGTLAAGVALLFVLPLTLAAPIALGIVAVTIGIARKPIADLAAGLTLLVATPYAVGEHIRLFLPATRQVARLEILEIRPLRTVVGSDTGIFALRNTQLLRAAPYQPTLGG